MKFVVYSIAEERGSQALVGHRNSSNLSPAFMATSHEKELVEKMLGIRTAAVRQIPSTSMNVYDEKQIDQSAF